MIKPDYSIAAPADLGKVHMVGIGGSGMSGIARLLLARGVRVTGSDSRHSSNTDRLQELGAVIHIGHDEAHVGEADTLIVTGALWENNPEYQLAKNKGLHILHRSQALEWLTRSSRLVAVAGAHGKTTSTGMIVTALREMGERPSFVNGGVVQAYQLSSAWGEGDVFVIEADESDGSFLLYDTSVALITNVDPDHLDHYGSMEAFEQAFIDFASGARDVVVISGDDPGARKITPHISAPKVVTFGEGEHNDVHISDITTSPQGVSVTVVWEEKEYSTVLSVPGRHNALNAAGAFSVLVGMGFDPTEAMKGLRAFAGTERRFELHGVRHGVSVYDDYAHHHNEVHAILSAARTVVGQGRLIAVHQPHLYSRTQKFAAEFAHTLEHDADITVVLDVYGAREDPVPGVTGELVSEQFTDPDKVFFISDWQVAAEKIAEISKPGDFVITLGCGDVYRIIPQILAELEKQ